VVVGRDYPTLRALDTQPVPSSTTSTTLAAGSTSSSTTTVTTPDTRYVPVSPKGLRPLVGCP
jgi:hypothetical protein